MTCTAESGTRRAGRANWECVDGWFAEGRRGVSLPAAVSRRCDLIPASSASMTTLYSTREPLPAVAGGG